MARDTIPCPHCGLPVPVNASRCIYCGMDPKSTSDSAAVHDLVPPGRTPQQTILWGFLGLISAGIGILIGSLFALPSAASSQAGVADPGSISLAFGLTSCLFGIVLAPVFGIIAGVAGYGFGKTRASGMIAAVLGGLLYALLAIGFGMINILLSG